MRVPGRGRAPPESIHLRVSEDDLAANSYSFTEVRLVAKIPLDMLPLEALQRFARAVGEFARDRARGVDGQVSATRAYYTYGRSQHPQAVVQPLICPPDARDALLSARDGRGWVDLPGWGGKAAVFTSAATRVLHLYGLPVGMDSGAVRTLLDRQEGVQVVETTPLVDDQTGLPRADAACFRVTAATNLPPTIQCTLPDNTTHTILVRSPSLLPPAPGEQAPRATYATAAAGPGPPPAHAPSPAGAAWGRAAVAPPAVPVAAPAAVPAAVPAMAPSPPPPAPVPPGAVGAGAPSGTADSEARQVPTTRQPGSPRGRPVTRSLGAAAAAATRGSSRPGLRGSSTPAPPSNGSPGPRSSSPLGQRGGGPAHPPAGSHPPGSPTAQAAAKRLRTANAFAALSDQEDMDADLGTQLAQPPLAAPPPPHAATA